jgi:2-methylisocitrate lyase-like PEP mutase family enzyme
VNAVAPAPVNVLVSTDFTTVADLARIGVRRISVGGALARSAWRGFIEAAEEIALGGTFTNLARATPSSVLERHFARASESDPR